jgi:hypothetical protein
MLESGCRNASRALLRDAAVAARYLTRDSIIGHLEDREREFQIRGRAANVGGA